MKKAIYKRLLTEATPSLRGCIGSSPKDGAPVVCCAGAVNKPYWRVTNESSGQANYESEYHQSWRKLVKPPYSERYFGATHRADLIGKIKGNNCVIEIQFSEIDIRDLKSRIETYYEETQERVIWVVNIWHIWDQKRFKIEETNTSKRYGIQHRINYQRPKQWLLELIRNPKCRVYLDYEDNSDKLLHAWINNKQIYASPYSKKHFFMKYLNECAKLEYKNYSEKAKEVLRDKPTPNKASEFRKKVASVRNLRDLFAIKTLEGKLFFGFNHKNE